MNPYTLLMGMQVLAATMENSMEIPQKTKNRTTMHIHAKTLQSCPACATLWDCSLLGSSVHWILKARILESVAMPYSGASSQLGI